EHYFVTYAVWKLGGQVLPLRAEIPALERDKILELAAPNLVISEWQNLDYPNLHPDDLAQSAALSADPLPDKVPDPGYALGSGGSTGRPKIIVTPGPMMASPASFGPGTLLHEVGVRPEQIQLIC